MNAAGDDEKASLPPVPSFEQFKKMMEQDVDPSKLSMGEQVQRGVSKSWANPAYWSRQFVTAQHISNNVPEGSRVLELGKDAKNLYYIKDPAEIAFVAPSLQGGEGPIREAAAKLSIPKFSVQIGPLDGMQLRAGGYDAVLCVDMLRGAPRADAQKVVAVMARCVALET